MPKKLYIGNLGYEVTEEELTQLFSQCGQVSSARIVKDKDSGRSKGFGFVEMINNDEATHAISRMRGQDFQGRPLQVDEAHDKPPEGAAERPNYDHVAPRRSGGGGGSQGRRGGR